MKSIIISLVTSLVFLSLPSIALALQVFNFDISATYNITYKINGNESKTIENVQFKAQYLSPLLEHESVKTDIPSKDKRYNRTYYSEFIPKSLASTRKSYFIPSKNIVEIVEVKTSN